jgi:hypothetical protein
MLVHIDKPSRLRPWPKLAQTSLKHGLRPLDRAVAFYDVCLPPSLSSLLPTYRCYPFFRPFTRAVSFYAVTENPSRHNCLMVAL